MVQPQDRGNLDPRCYPISYRFQPFYANRRYQAETAVAGNDRGLKAAARRNAGSISATVHLFQLSLFQC